MNEPDADVFEALQGMLLPGITGTAFLIALSILAVAITRYFLAARLRSIAQAVDLGVKSPEARGQCEGLIARAIQLKLEKHGMVERYSAAGQAHRGIFLLGCACCMVALLFLLAAIAYQTFSDQVPALAVDTALASKYGSFFAFQDVGSNAWIVLIMTASMATVWWVILFVYYRGRCVWSLIRGQRNVSEPDKVDKTDVLLCSIGCGFPLFAVGFVVSLVSATRTLTRFEERARNGYTTIESIAGNEDLFDHTPELRTWIQATFEGIPAGTKQQSTACAAVVEAYLDGTEADPDKIQSEADVVAECLGLLCDDGHGLTVMRSTFYESEPRWYYLRQAIQGRIPDLSELFNGMEGMGG